MAHTLLIDTSHKTAQAALVKNGSIIAHRTWPNGPQVGRDLLVEIDGLLQENHLALSDVNRIAVHAGPGGYSSLRAGIVTTLMLRATHSVEIIAVEGETLEDMVAEAQTALPTEHLKPRYPQ